jgi:hypothetical protein
MRQGALWSHGDLVGHGPHEPHQLTGNRHDDLVGMFPLCQQASVACAQSSLGVPAEVLDGFGVLFQSELEMPADFGGIAIRPGTFHERAPRMRVAGCGERTLPAALPRGIFRGDQPQALHEWSRILDAREGTEFRDRIDGHRTLDLTQGLEGFDDGLSTPRWDLFVECLFQPLESLAVCGDRADVCLADQLLRGCGPDDCRAPSKVGWPPGGPALITEILTQQEGLQAVRGGLEIPNRLLAGAGQVADRLVFDRGDIDRREIPGAQQPGERHGVAAVRLDTVPWFPWDERRGNHPADEVLLSEIAVEPIATGPGFIDQEQLLGFRLALADQDIDVALPGADGAQEDDLRAMLLRGIGHGDGLFVHIQPDVNRGRVSHG